MNSEYVLGIDCGTQSTKAILFNLSGVVVSQGSAPLSLTRNQPGYAEQNAQDWWDSICQALAPITSTTFAEQIKGVSITYQRETFTLVDADFRPLRPAILWMDQRAYREESEIRARISDERFKTITGKLLNPTPSIMKLKWIRKNEPKLWSQASRIVTVGAFINYHLTGNVCDSLAGADTTGLIDIKSKKWSDELLGILDLAPNRLFDLLPSGACAGRITQTAARRTGLKQGTPVYIAGGDGQVFAVGVGAICESEMAITLGTSGICGVHGKDPYPGTASRTMLACVKDKYFHEAVIMSAGNTVSWFVRNFDCPDPAGRGERQEAAELRLEGETASVPPCCDGLLTIPYLRGCMMPYNEPGTRGATLGWSDIHTSAHLYRSILEGIAFEIKLILEEYKQHSGIEMTSLRLGGGGAKSNTWSQIIADITGIETLVSETTENTALGAAVLAAVGLGLYQNVESAIAGMCKTGKAFYPNKTISSVYGDFFARVYKKIYPAIREYLCLLGDKSLYRVPGIK